MSAANPFDYQGYLREYFRHAIWCARNKARITSRTEIFQVLAASQCGVITPAEMKKRNPDFKP